MDRMGEEPRSFDLAGRVIGCAMRVHAALGSGFLESVYRNALAIELRNSGFSVEAEHSVTVYYQDQVVGTFVADLIVVGVLIIEPTAVQLLTKQHEVQLVNYLTATGIDDGLVFNFGAERLEFKRKFRRPKTEEVTF
jgi:GxxExxY protein